MTVTNHSLQVSKVVQADRETVFAAWTRPELMKDWYSPEGLKPVHVFSNPKVGGHFRDTMKGQSGVFTASGVYKEIIPNEKLVFTHRWADSNKKETLVTVNLRDREDGTEVILTQEKFSDPEQVSSHEQVWISALENLSKLVPSQVQ